MITMVEMCTCSTKTGLVVRLATCILTLHRVSMEKNQHESGFSGGLSLAVHCINIKIIITDSFLRGNTAYNDGGNLALSFINTTHLFPSNVLTLSNSYIEDGVSYRGGGVFIKILQVFSKKNNTCNINNIFHFSDTHFIGNSAELVSPTF